MSTSTYLFKDKELVEYMMSFQTGISVSEVRDKLLNSVSDRVPESCFTIEELFGIYYDEAEYMHCRGYRCICIVIIEALDLIYNAMLGIEYVNLWNSLSVSNKARNMMVERKHNVMHNPLSFRAVLELIPIEFYYNMIIHADRHDDSGLRCMCERYAINTVFNVLTKYLFDIEEELNVYYYYD